MSRGYAAIGLYMPKTEANFGGAMRAAYCYGAALIAIQGRRFRRLSADTQKAWRHIPLIQCSDLRDIIPFDCVPVCVEVIDGARNLIEFTH